MSTRIVFWLAPAGTEAAWGVAGLAGEELPEVGGFGESDHPADRGDGQVGVYEQALRLQGDARVDEFLGGAAGGGLTG